ncbi:MAG: methionyl-tRNA formyltransferase, partial [Micromonosporaceae bacterium]
GACVFQLEQGLDTGPIFGSLTEPIGPRDTSGDLLRRLADSGARLLLDVLDAIEQGAAHAEPQPADGVSLAPKVAVSDAEVRWHEPAFAVDRRVRACTPDPGAWSVFRGDRVRIFPVAPTHSPDPALRPGELRVVSGRALVGTASAPVELGTVQPAGKKQMAAADWLRGARPEPGERFESTGGTQ